MNTKITLSNLANATAQEIFNQVCEHLNKQGEPCTVDVDGYPSCRYHEGDLRCAAGCLISEEEYQDRSLYKHEGRGWTYLANMHIVPDNHFSLITDLQRVHDMNKPDQWENELRRVGLAYNLDTTVLDE